MQVTLLASWWELRHTPKKRHLSLGNFLQHQDGWRAQETPAWTDIPVSIPTAHFSSRHFYSSVYSFKFMLTQAQITESEKLAPLSFSYITFWYQSCSVPATWNTIRKTLLLSVEINEQGVEVTIEELKLFSNIHQFSILLSMVFVCVCVSQFEMSIPRPLCSFCSPEKHLFFI